MNSSTLVEERTRPGGVVEHYLGIDGHIEVVYIEEVAAKLVAPRYRTRVRKQSGLLPCCALLGKQRACIIEYRSRAEGLVPGRSV